MKLFNALFHSSLGKKYVMGMTGLALFGFVIGHMLGNLQIFLGPDKINAYGAFLKSMPKLLWVARISLLACVFGPKNLPKTFPKRGPNPPKIDAKVSSVATSRSIRGGGIIITEILRRDARGPKDRLTRADAEGEHERVG